MCLRAGRFRPAPTSLILPKTGSKLPVIVEIIGKTAVFKQVLFMISC
jgi:hypothetical protein